MSIDLYAGFGPLSSSVLRLKDRVPGPGAWGHPKLVPEPTAASWPEAGFPSWHAGPLDSMGLVWSPTGDRLWPGCSTSITSVTRMS